MVKTAKYFFIAITLLLLAGCGKPVVPPVNGEDENITFIEQPRDVSILASDGSVLRLTLYPNTNAFEGIVLVSLSEGLWIEDIPLLQEEYEVLFLSADLVEYVVDAENYLLQRREVENVFVVSHNVIVELENYLLIDDVSADGVKQKIKGFINN